MKGGVDVVYVVASKLGSIGMGSTAYNAIKGIEDSELRYKCFCRGYDKKLKINKKNLSKYLWLEYITYPFRFLEKVFHIKINSFKFANSLFGKLIHFNLPKTRIYHTWIGISPKAIEKAKKEGAILILEGANSHPLNILKIMDKEYKKNHQIYSLDEKKSLLAQSKIVKKFDYIMCPSEFVYKSFLDQGFKENQLIKLPYGVDLKKINPSQKKSNKKIKFIFVGSIQLRKGVEYLLRAWKELKLKNAELIIVGRIWPDAKNILEKYKEDKTINIVGFTPTPEKYLKEADVFISPSLEEGSALTCYEAMSYGLPLIATYNTGSIIKDKQEGFIIPAGDVEQLKKKINYLYSHPEERKRMGKNSLKKIKKYGWKDYILKLNCFYRKVLKDEKR